MGTGASAGGAKKAVQGASFDEMKALLEQVEPADRSRLQDALNAVGKDATGKGDKAGGAKTVGGKAKAKEEGDGCNSLHLRRPAWLSKADKTFFKQQTTAGKDKAYGAVGGPNYTVSVIEHKGGQVSREDLWGVRDLVAGHKDPKSLRILDLGTGDGHILLSLHKEFGIPWSNLMGVSAEDMRGMPEVLDVKDCKEPANLREVPEAEGSYVVWNIEDLKACPALKGRQFDVVISWITWCWLTDPFSAIEVVHDHFLAEGGLLAISSVQLVLKDVGAIDDQVYLAALRDRLCAEGHKVDVLKDPISCVYSYWLQRKTRECLNLWPLLKFDSLVEETLKVAYTTELAAGPELDAFSVDRATVL